MIIKWIDGDREIPKIGVLETGYIYNVPDDIGRNLIRQRQAKVVKEKPDTAEFREKNEGRK